MCLCINWLRLITCSCIQSSVKQCVTLLGTPWGALNKAKKWPKVNMDSKVMCWDRILLHFTWSCVPHKSMELVNTNQSYTMYNAKKILSFRKHYLLKTVYEITCVMSSPLMASTTQRVRWSPLFRGDRPQRIQGIQASAKMLWQLVPVALKTVRSEFWQSSRTKGAVTKGLNDSDGMFVINSCRSEFWPFKSQTEDVQ